LITLMLLGARWRSVRRRPYCGICRLSG